MARFLAIDWDDREYRYLLASVQKGVVSVLKAGRASLDAPEQSDEAGRVATERAVALSLRRRIREERLDSCPLLMALDRSHIEMLYVNLPPCKEVEIPVMLKNQVLRELPSFSDYDPLDYLSLGNRVDEGRKLLALTIPMSFRQSLKRHFRAAGRTPQRIGFRAVSAAELVIHCGLAPEQFEQGLVVNVVGNEVDLVLLEGREFVSIRSFRLPEQLAFLEIVDRIADEIRRTLALSLEPSGSGAVVKIFLFGGQDDWTPLVETLQKDALDVCLLNPFSPTGQDVPIIVRPANFQTPEIPGAFAPLMGMLLSQLPGRKNRIDFLHPKEAAKPANYVLASLLGLIFLGICAYGLFAWNQKVIQSMETELAKVKVEHAQVAAQVQEILPRWNVLNQTRIWESQNVSWLDELRVLSLLMPGEQDIVVTQMSFTGPINNDPRMRSMVQVRGLVRDPTVLWKLQTDLRNQGYLMQNPNPAANPAGGGYPWQFQTAIYRTR